MLLNTNKTSSHRRWRRKGLKTILTKEKITDTVSGCSHSKASSFTKIKNKSCPLPQYHFNR